MYPNLLLSIFIGLIAIQIIGGMVDSPRLAKVADVPMVATLAAALIVWLFMGLSPVPHWLAKGAVRLVHAGQRLGHR